MPILCGVQRDDLAAHLTEPVTTAARKDFPLLRIGMTVESALAHIRKTGIGEKIIYFYVADADDHLAGVVPTRRLLLSELDQKIADIMVTGVVAIPENASLLEACELFILYKYLAFPVVDSQRRVVGVIDIGFFAAEVFEMSDEESHDEIFETIGLHVEQLRNAAPLTAFRVRFPWLLGTIASGVMCAFLAGAFEQTLAHALAITFFLPLVLGLNESVAMQSMTLSLQSLHGRQTRRDAVFSRLRRELVTALMLGFGCSLVAGLIAGLWRHSAISALVIGGAIFGSMIVSGTIGFFVPLLLRIGRRDPKIAAGPIALAMVDVAALLFYFTLAKFALT